MIITHKMYLQKQSTDMYVGLSDINLSEIISTRTHFILIAIICLQL